MCTHLFKFQNLFYFSVYKFNVWPLPHCYSAATYFFFRRCCHSLSPCTPCPAKFQLIWVLSSNSQPTIQPERTDTTSCFMATMQTSFASFRATRLVRESRAPLNEFGIDSESVEWKTKQKQNGQNYHEMISCPVVYVRKHIFSYSFLLVGQTNVWIFLSTFPLLWYRWIRAAFSALRAVYSNELWNGLISLSANYFNYIILFLYFPFPSLEWFIAVGTLISNYVTPYRIFVCVFVYCWWCGCSRFVLFFWWAFGLIFQTKTGHLYILTHTQRSSLPNRNDFNTQLSESKQG